MGIHTREAAMVFLAHCFTTAKKDSERPIAGWSILARDYVPITTPEEMDEYLLQFPWTSWT